MPDVEQPSGDENAVNYLPNDRRGGLAMLNDDLHAGEHEHGEDPDKLKGEREHVDVDDKLHNDRHG